MNKPIFPYLLVAGIILFFLTIASLFLGVFQFRIENIFPVIKSLITHNDFLTENERFVLLQLRLPRIVMAIMVGSALAVSGTVLQGIFQNPLATPDFIGVTAGSTVMAATTIVFGHAFLVYFPDYLQYSVLGISAFIGALGAMWIVYKMANINGKTNIVVMLLSGVAITALGFAFTGLLVYLAKDNQLRDITFWNLGSLSGANWTKNCILFVTILISFAILLRKGKALNALMLGEIDAQHLGIPVEKLKTQIILLSALLVGITVSMCGNIGFIGLIVPYILRLLFKSNYTIILPLSIFLGSIILLVADTISRTIVQPSELPIGIITAFMGAPIFISILIRNKKSFT